YRPWEAHYRLRPASWWDRQLTRAGIEAEPARPSGRRALPPAGGLGGWLVTWFPAPGLSQLERELEDGGPQAGPGLAELLGSPDRDTRKLACILLWRLGPRVAGEVRAPLLDALRGPDTAQNARARRALHALDPAALAAYDRDHPPEGRP